MVYRSPQKQISLALTLRFESGRWAQLMLDSSQPRIQERLEISGTADGANALIVVDNVQHMEFHKQISNGVDVLKDELWQITPEVYLQDVNVWRPDYAIPNMGQSRLFFQGFVGEMREFVDAIIEGRQPYPGTDDVLKAMRVIEAVANNPDGTTAL
jgi:predicted dehydrogenase